jgi:hypothetical protein
MYVAHVESSAYPGSFDFREVLQSQRGHPEWGSYAAHLLAKGYVSPKQGHDAGTNYSTGICVDNGLACGLLVCWFVGLCPLSLYLCCCLCFHIHWPGYCR